MRRAVHVLILAAAIVALCAAAYAESPLPLKAVVDITLPGPTNRFDYQSVNLRTHRLFIAHLGAGTVVVIDTRGPTVVGEVKNLRSVHGVSAMPELGLSMRQRRAPTRSWPLIRRHSAKSQGFPAESIPMGSPTPPMRTSSTYRMKPAARKPWSTCKPTKWWRQLHWEARSATVNMIPCPSTSSSMCKLLAS
jgi:hypothetical protein